MKRNQNDLTPKLPERINEYESILLFLPEKNEFVFMEYGSGEQLLWEDRKAGYDDYINIQTYSFDGDFNEEDGGLLMFKNEERNIYRHIDDVLMEMYGQKLKFIILQAS